MSGAIEIELTLAGRTWTLRPTVALIRAVERATGGTIYRLGLRLAAGEVSFTEFNAAMHAALKATEPKQAPTPDEVGEGLVEAGYLAVAEPFGQICLGAFNGAKGWEEMQRQEAPAAAEADPPKD